MRESEPLNTLHLLADRERPVALALSPTGRRQSITLRLPFPPATNNLFLNAGKRRVRTKRYDAWIAEAMAEVFRQRVGRLDGRYAFAMRVERPDRRLRDLDGLIKPVMDLLVKAGVTADDSLCQGIVVHWAGPDPVKNASVIVTVESVG